MKTSTDLKIELKQLEQQRDDLIAEAKQLEERLKIVRQLTIQLEGNRYSNGSITTKMNEIVIAESREKDELSSYPIWINPPEERTEGDNAFVISRITKKRIWVRPVGGNEVAFSREEGTPVYDSFGYNQARLDVKATVEAWSANTKSRK